MVVFLPLFTGIFTIVNVWSGSTANPQQGVGDTGVRVLTRIDGTPPAINQQASLHSFVKSGSIADVALAPRDG